MRSAPRLYDFTAAALAVALSILAIGRMITVHGLSPGFTRGATLAGGVVFAAILLTSAVGLALHRSFGWGFGVLGFLVVAAAGVIVRAGGDPFGVVYLVAAPFLLGLLIKDLHAYRTEPPTAAA